MSVFTYNGISLPYASMLQFDQRVMYDEKGNTDWYCTQFDIVVQGMINTNYLAAISPDIAAQNFVNAAEIMTAIRTRLERPRRLLSYTFNGIQLIPQPPAGQTGTVDAQNGPKPQKISITQMTNAMFVVTFHVIAHYWERDATAGGTTLNPVLQIPVINQPGVTSVLYNRWTESVELDDLQMSTRTREGRFVIRSDNATGSIADQIRSQMAITGVPSGFVRDRSSYTVTADGLGIEYRVIDKEVFRVPPGLAKRARGEYIETAVGALGGGKPFTTAQCRVSLSGDKDTDQGRLAFTAFQIATQKIAIQGAQLGGKFGFALFDHATLKVDLFENNVDFNIRAVIKPATTKGGKGRKFGIWGFRFGGLSNVPQTSQKGSPIYNDRGSASLLLQAASYYDPNLQNRLNRGKDQMNNGLQVGQAGVSQE